MTWASFEASEPEHKNIRKLISFNRTGVDKLEESLIARVILGEPNNLKDIAEINTQR